MNSLVVPDVDVSPQPLYQLAIGFAASQTLFVAHRLGVFQALHEKKVTAENLAEQLRCSSEALEMLLNACVSIRLCRKENGQFSNEAVADCYLVPGRAGYLGRFMDHFHDHMLPAWQHLEKAIQSGHAQIQRVLGNPEDHFFRAIDQEKKNLETFMETMEEHSLLEGQALARVYDFSAHRHLLDVAGGTGAMSVAILRAWPHLHATVFDRPPVGDISIPRIQQHGLAHRIEVRRGDFFADPLPSGADVLLLSGILHNWSPVNARRILSACARAAVPGTILLISEQVLSADKTEPLAGTLCSLNMLVMMEGGQEYSGEEFRAMLAETGWHLDDIRSTQGVRQLLVASRS